MWIWFRSLSIWCIVLALPLQGLAAATMVHCGLSHARMVQDHAQAHAQAHTQAHTQAHAQAHAGHGQSPEPLRQADLSHHHTGAAGALGSGHGSPSGQPDIQGDAPALAKYQCSACAACCAGSAPPSLVSRIPVIPTPPVVFTSALVSVDALASDAPDRPPRAARV